MRHWQITSQASNFPVLNSVCRVTSRCYSRCNLNFEQPKSRRTSQLVPSCVTWRRRNSADNSISWCCQTFCVLFILPSLGVIYLIKETGSHCSLVHDLLLLTYRDESHGVFQTEANQMQTKCPSYMSVFHWQKKQTCPILLALGTLVAWVFRTMQVSN